MKHSEHDPQGWKRQVREDLLIWFALLILLGITFGGSFAPWGIGSTLVSFTVSAIKTLLIGFFYMHLKKEKGMTRVFALAGAAWLAILFFLTLSDYTTRSWLPYPAIWPIFVQLRPSINQ